MNLSTAELDALQSSMLRIGIFFRLETAPVVRLWLGVGLIKPGINVLDPSGATYVGFGSIRDVPNIKQLINGRAERVDFTISGVSGAVLKVASGGDPDQVKGKRVTTGFALMDADWRLLGSVHWTGNYTADYLALEQASSDDPAAPIVRSIRLSCGTLLTSRRRPSLSYFSHQDQVARFPGDRFCERTPVYANGFSKTWPTFPS